MEVKPGYNKTEVGVIPEDWHHLNISAFAHVLTGPFGTLLKASEYTEGEGVPLISVGEVREGFFRVDEKTPRVCTLVLKRLPQYALKDGDIVFGRKGGVNRSALVTKKEEGWFLGSDGIRIRPDGNHCHSYLAMQLRSFRVQSWLLQNSIGTTMPSLNQGILCRVQVALPPTLHEQTAIATALSDVDALLDGLDRLIAKKRDLKQATMQQLLTGQRRLPGFSGEWDVKRLGEILTICHGRSQHEIEVLDGPYPILATGGQIGTASKYLYDKPSVLIGRKGTIDQPQYMDRPFWTVLRRQLIGSHQAA